MKDGDNEEVVTEEIEIDVATYEILRELADKNNKTVDEMVVIVLERAFSDPSWVQKKTKSP